MQLAFYFDQSRCTGCFACCIACKDWHDIPPGRARWMRVSCIEEGEFPKVFVAYLASACHHCHQASCVSACPAEAITKREEDGIVVVDRDKCLGESVCGAPCKLACPYDSPQFGDEENARMQKCDLCLERWQTGKKPVCVDACPTRALSSGPLDEFRAKYGDVHEAAGFIYSAELEPSTIFKPKPRSF